MFLLSRKVRNTFKKLPKVDDIHAHWLPIKECVGAKL